MPGTTNNLQTKLQKANAECEQYEMGGYGADSLGVSTVSFCDEVTVGSPSMPLLGSVAVAAAGSDLATSAFGMSQVASADDGCDAFCCCIFGSFSMFASSNSYHQNNNPLSPQLQH